MNPTRAAEPQRRYFGSVRMLAFNLRVRNLNLLLNPDWEILCGLIKLYSHFFHLLRADKRSGVIKNLRERWSVFLWNRSPDTQRFLGYRYRPPPRQEGFKDGPKERGPLSPPTCKSQLCSRPSCTFVSHTLKALSFPRPPHRLEV